MNTQQTGAAPVLSVVIGVVSDTTGPADASHLADCLAAFSGQIENPPVELIVPHLERFDGLDEVRRKFPYVRFLPVSGLAVAPGGGREHHDVLRAHGLLASRGEYVALIEDHAKPDPAFCANVIAAHRHNDAAIGGAIENGVDRAINWAVYFCDFGKYQNPVPEGDSFFASDANVSYRKSTLDSIRPEWESSFREVIVNGTLRSGGTPVRLSPNIIVYQNRTGLRLATALRERYIWGRSYAATRNMQLTMAKRLVHAVLTPVLPLVLTARIGMTAWKRRRLFARFVRSIHLVVTLQISWSLGEGLGYLLGLGDSPRSAATGPRA